MNRYRIVILIVLLAACGKAVQSTGPLEDRDHHGHADQHDGGGGLQMEGEAAIEAGMAEVRRLDAMMSLYLDDSEIARVNRAAGMHSVTVSPEISRSSRAPQRSHALSGGVFDVTIAGRWWSWRCAQGRDGSGRTRDQPGFPRPCELPNIVVDRKACALPEKTGMIMVSAG